jgi:hypothetical protein
MKIRCILWQSGVAIVGPRQVDACVPEHLLKIIATGYNLTNRRVMLTSLG